MAKLGDYISIKHGFAFKGDGITGQDNGVVLVTPGNFAIGGGFKEEKCKFFNGTYPEEYVLSPEDLIVTMTDLSKDMDTLGFSALIPDSNRVYLHNQRIGLVKIVNNKIDKHFLYWYMRTRNYQRVIAGSASGTTVHHTSPNRICDIDVDFPNINVQRRIAGILDDIETKIRNNNNINQNLQEQAIAIYARMITEASEDSWRSGVLSDIADITMGQSPKGDTYNEDGIGTVFFQGRAEFGFRFPSRRLFTTDSKRMAKANDTLMSVRAPVGDINVAYEDCCIGRGLSAIRSKDNHQSFVLYTMLALRDELNVFNGEGTVFGSINRDSLNSMEVTIPPKEIIDCFEAIVSPMDEAIRNNYDEICRLETIRDSLLPRLMNGDIDISNVDI